ncbi:MAG: protease pro-enzyme activation domain-containing protein [Solirubrobacteraceae bacterium]
MSRGTVGLAVASLAVAGIGGASGSAAGASARAHTGASSDLAGIQSAPRLAGAARSLGALPAGKRVQVALPLKLPRAAALDSFVTGQYTPGSPHYREFLTPDQFGARFGAPRAEVQRALTSLRKLGLRVASPPANRLYISATGEVGTLERVFGVRLDRFRLPNGRTFFANAAAIHLPAALRDTVTGVIGLDDTARPVSHLARARSAASLPLGVRARVTRAAGPKGVDGGATPCPAAVSSGGYTAPDLAQGYDFNGMYSRGFHGEHMSAALVEFDDYHDSNVRGMEACYKVKTPVSRRLVDGGVGGPPGGGEDEDMADITTILELNPRLAHLYVYEAPITGGAAIFDEGTAELDLYNAFVTDDKAPVLSVSWGFCENLQSASYDQLFGRIAEEAAAQGQQIVDASGDSGAVDCLATEKPTLGSINVEQETAVPWITGVGGTDLGQDSTVPESGIHDEDTWNDDAAGGGGQSNIWRMPGWQAAYLGATHHKVAGAANACGAPAGRLCRMVPDVAMNADPEEGGALGSGPTPPQFATNTPPDVGSPGDDAYCATSNCSVTGAPVPPGSPGAWFAIGGTSLAAPTAAAAAVLWDQQARAAGLGSFGFLNPSLYRIATRKAAYARDFHDVLTDTNDAQYDRADCPPGCNPHHLYKAGKGYDMATGLGSPDVAKLGADLVKDAEHVDLTPSTQTMYGYLKGPSTTAPVSVTSGYRGSTYHATSSASWLHVKRSGKLPGTLVWRVDPHGLSSGTRSGHITITGAKGSTATLTVKYTVGRRARISVSPGGLRFTERAITASGKPTKPKCGSTTWNDELKNQLTSSSDATAVAGSTRRTLHIGNRGRRGSTLHYEAFFRTFTSSWLTEDLNPHNRPNGFRVRPSPPLVPTAGAVKAGRAAGLKLASIGNANALGGYPALNQGTYHGVVEIRDLADPRVLRKVSVTLVLGSGRGTPTIAPRPRSISVALAPGKTKRVNLVLADSSHTCGFSYSLQRNRPWVKINRYLLAGNVAARPARSAPSASDTGRGNGFTPLTISTKSLARGIYHATVIIQSQDAVRNPSRVRITLAVGRPLPRHAVDGRRRARGRRSFTG